MKIGFIGAAGNIASALINGIIKCEFINNYDVFLFDINTEGLKKYEKLGCTICNDSAELVDTCDYIFLTVKPQVIFNVISGFSAKMTAKKCIISVAAGITVDAIKKAIGFDCKVIRVMPNTPLMVAQGASGIVKQAPVNDDEFSFVLKIFSLLGVAVETSEDNINIVTAVSGSGPAYVFRFAKNIIEQAVELGLDYETASTLMYQTLIGSAVMLRDSGMSPQKLIDMVTSPKGTTLAALCSFDDSGFDKSVMEAVKACKIRADELGASK